MPPLDRRSGTAVGAAAAISRAVSAEVLPVELRRDKGLSAGSYVHDGPSLTTGWHRHDLHQLEYARSGTVGLETPQARFVLTPQQVAWIPAGVRHISTLGDARTVSVFLSPELVDLRLPQPGGIAASPLLREMILYAVRWPIARLTTDPVADAFFAAFGSLVPGWTAETAQFALPVSAEPLVAQAIAYTHAHLATVSHARLARAIGTSERTLRRRFAAETGMSWRQYVVLARLLEALGLLASSDASVMHIASRVGFESTTAFTRAFLRRTGETPSAYRRRAHAD